MTDNTPVTSFWRTIPGILTGVAGILTAITGLVVALSQIGVLPRRGASDSTAAATPPAIDGLWSAQVTYPWGVSQRETFRFQVEGGRILGAATYLGVPRAIEDGTISGTHVVFTTRVEEFSGDVRRTYRNHYDGIVAARGIQFVLRDTRGGASIEFTGTRPQ